MTGAANADVARSTSQQAIPSSSAEAENTVPITSDEESLEDGLPVGPPSPNEGAPACPAKGGSDSNPALDDEDTIPLAKRRRSMLARSSGATPESSFEEAAAPHRQAEGSAAVGAGTEPEVVTLLEDTDDEKQEAAGTQGGVKREERLEEPAVEEKKEDSVEYIELSSEGEDEDVAEQPMAGGRGPTEQQQMDGKAGPSQISRPNGGNGLSHKPVLGAKASRTPNLDVPYEFSSREAATAFNKGFKKPRVPHGMGAYAIQKRARELLNKVPPPKPAVVQKTQSAWHSAAMAWRQKNMPSETEVKRRQQEDAARMNAAAQKLRSHRTPAEHAQRAQAAGGGASRLASAPVPVPSAPPPADAPEMEWRSYYRIVNQAKAAAASSFAQVLRTFKVPVLNPTGVKNAYRAAVRMYHPDSNSKDRAWSTAREKLEAEEIMKIINEKKPDDL